MDLTATISRVRIRIFSVDPTTRGVGIEKAIIYDAKNIGSEVYANDVGSAFWTLPVDHPAVPILVPLKVHYKIERHNAVDWVLIGAGLLSEYDATSDEIVYNGMDYMAMMDMHYTPLLGAEPNSTASIVRETVGSTTTATSSVELTASHSASMLYNTTSDWNSNDTEVHIPVGQYSSPTSVQGYYTKTSDSTKIVLEVASMSGFTVGETVYISGVGVSRIDGSRVITELLSNAIVFTSGSGNLTYHVASGYCYQNAYYVRGLLKFDLPSDLTSSSTVTSAKLIMTLSNTSGDHMITDSTAKILSVKRVDSVDWTGDTTTGSEGNWSNSSNANCDWGTMNGQGVSTGAVSYTLTSTSHNSKHTIDITTIAQAWTTSPNNGLILQNGVSETSITDGLSFYSQTISSSSYKPKLQITYTNSVTVGSNVNANGLEKNPKETKSLVRDRGSYSSARQQGKEIACYVHDGLANADSVNKVNVVYNELDQTYTVSGVVFIERSAINDAEKIYDINKDNYIPNRFQINSVKVILTASPGDEVCTFNVWPSSWTVISSTYEAPVELAWSITLRDKDSALAEVIAPASTVPTLTASSGVYSSWTGTTRNVINSYSINCLTSGVNYMFYATPTIVIQTVTPQTTSSVTYGTTHDLNGVGSSSGSTSTIMGLEKKTLQDIFSKQIPPLISSGAPNSRFGWLSTEVASGSTWGTDYLRYFTSGESVLSHLRSMCEKEMAANMRGTRYDVIDGIKVPYRAVFNFVGMRNATATGSKLTIAPARSSTDPEWLFDYPGSVDKFRYKRNGKSYRNAVRVIPSTTFLTGTASSTTGSRSKGVEKVSDATEYGYAPMLVSQPNFADTEELGKYAQNLLDRSNDILNVSVLQITLKPDTVEIYENFYLGDVVRVTVRRTNVNGTDLSAPDFISDVYIIGGVTIEIPPDATERVTLDLVKASDFGKA